MIKKEQIRIRCRLNKGGQITIFIIIGILTLLLIGGFFTLRVFILEGEAKEADLAPVLSSSIQNYIETCIENKGMEAVNFISSQGGYYNLPELYDLDLSLPYYLYENKSHVISKNELASQLSSYMNNELFFCIRNFAPFKEAGLDIEQEEIITEVIINSNKVVFDVTLPLIITQDALVKNLAYFSSSVFLPLGKIHNTVSEFMDLEKDDSKYCVSCLLDILIREDLRVETTSLEDGTIWFIIIDDKSSLEYHFLNQYDFERS